MGFLREPSHLLIIALVVLVLFGGKKLPEAARGLGRSMRIFKSEVKQMRDEDDEPKSTSEPGGPLEGRVMGRDSAAPVPPPAAPEQQPVHHPDERRPGA